MCIDFCLDSILIFNDSPYGGASSAGAYLECFVEKDVKWAHIDIAG